ncbi:hypothetical protein PoB_001006400 [Plakobranchus ocellatus]|uniref:Uncharacterized protein n=1 Tax=Plakobranchus ocellatus TaxID=259542 RepID=A0AAV3YNC6_9GAST|nr:hypothetical protein PoB_001006400 [Plakobranchus ocellatus]
MHKVNLDPVVLISLSRQGAGAGARTRDTKLYTDPRQVRYSPVLAIVSAVGSIAKSIVFALVHTSRAKSASLRLWIIKYNNEGSSFHS